MTRTLLLLSFLLIGGQAWAEDAKICWMELVGTPNDEGSGSAIGKIEPRSWHLLTKSYGGTVSLIKNLTKKECEFPKNRLLGQPATDAERQAKDHATIESLNTKCPDNWDDEPKWRLQHLGATQCTEKNGVVTGLGGSYSRMSASDIVSAECFE